MMFNTDTLTPAMRGRLDKHLNGLVRDHDGNVVTFRAHYESGRYVAKRKPVTVHVYGRSNPETAYDLVTADNNAHPVPKMVHDAIELPEVEW